MDGTQVVVVNNPLKHFERDIHLVPDLHGKDLLTIRNGLLPSDINFSIAVNGEVVPFDYWPLYQVKNGDSIVCVPRVEAEGAAAAIAGAIAVAAEATAVTAAGAAITTLAMAIEAGAVLWAAVYVASYVVISVVGGLLINAVMSAFTPDSKPAGSAFDQSSTYSWNPSSTQKIGSVIPRVYGIVRTHGNITAAYSNSNAVNPGLKTETTDQYMNVLISFGYGPIAGITSAKINDQPIENLTGVVLSQRLGFLKQAVIPYFRDIPSQEAMNITVNHSDTAEGGVVHTTIHDDFDGLEVDVTFPSGIYFMDNAGNIVASSVCIQIQYRRIGDTDWIDLTQPAMDMLIKDEDFTVDNTLRWGLGRNVWAASASMILVDNTNMAPLYNVLVRAGYRIGWDDLGSVLGRLEVSPTDICTALGITTADLEDPLWFNKYIPEFYGSDFSSGEFSFGPTPDTSSIPGIDSDFPFPYNSGYNWKYSSIHVSGSVEATAYPYQRIAAQTTSSVTYTFKSSNTLPHGRYEIRVTKYTEDMKLSVYGDVTKLTAVREIYTDNISYPREVMISANALATGQLSGTFDYSCLMYGLLIRVWNGSVWKVQFNNNPAWVCYDAITQPVYNDPSFVTNGGSTYICHLSHTANSTNQPGVGSDWTTYWMITDNISTTTYTIPAWVSGTSYVDITDAGVSRYEGYNPARLDYAMFKVWADWCDVYVPTGGGVIVTGSDGNKYGCIKAHISDFSVTQPIVGSDWSTYWARVYTGTAVTWRTDTSYTKSAEKRFVFNGSFDTEYNMWDAASKIAAGARASLIFNGYQITVVIDKSDTAVQLFSQGNIKAGSFEEVFLSFDDRASEIEITFLNEEKDYQRDICSIYNSDILNPENKVAVQAVGTTSPSQAWRIGQYTLLCNQYLKRTIKFEASIDAIACTIGDVINFQHDVPRWGLAGGRLVSATVNTVTIDTTLSLAAGTYTIMIRYSAVDADGADLLVTKDIILSQAVETNAFTVSTPFSIIPALYDVYAFGGHDIEVKPFRVIDIEQSQDLDFIIHAMEYDENIYSVDTGEPVVPSINYSNTPTSLAVTNLTLTNYNRYDQTGNFVRSIRVSFKRPNGFSYRRCLVKYRYETADASFAWVSAGETETEEFMIENVVPLATYTVMVVSITLANEYLPAGLCPSSTIRTTNVTGADTIGLITGLEIRDKGNSHEFDGKDCEFVWNKITAVPSAISAGNEVIGAGSTVPPVWFRDYEVKIFTIAGVQRGLTRYTTENKFTYTYDANCEDGNGTPVSSFKISVSARDRLGNVSDRPSSMTVSNSLPVTLGVVTANSVVGGVIFSWDRASDIDLKGYCYTAQIGTEAWPTTWIDITDCNVTVSLTATQVNTYGNKALVTFRVKTKDVFDQVSALYSEASANANYVADNLFKLTASTDGIGTASQLYDGNLTSGGVIL